MPSWPVRCLLAALWLGGIGWHAAVEWRGPAAGGLTYRQLLGQRAGDESASWALTLDGVPAGEALTATEALPEGGFRVRTAAALEGRVLAGLGDRRARLTTVAAVSPFGRLTELRATAALDGTPLQVSLVGAVVGSELELRIDASEPALPEPFRGPFRAPIDLHRPLTGTFAPLDRLPGLALGQRWTTPVFDPLRFLGPRLPALGAPATEARHEVVGVEALLWAGETTECFVVEDRQADATGRTYVRRRDGLVLRQEASLGRRTLALERRK